MLRSGTHFLRQMLRNPILRRNRILKLAQFRPGDIMRIIHDEHNQSRLRSASTG
jgi:hypothetical protein